MRNNKCQKWGKEIWNAPPSQGRILVSNVCVQLLFITAFLPECSTLRKTLYAYPGSLYMPTTLYTRSDMAIKLKGEAANCQPELPPIQYILVDCRKKIYIWRSLGIRIKILPIVGKLSPIRTSPFSTCTYYARINLYCKHGLRTKKLASAGSVSPLAVRISTHSLARSPVCQSISFLDPLDG